MNENRHFENDESRISPKPEDDIAALDGRLAQAEPAEKGAAFEQWSEQHIFGDKKRIRIAPEHNQHLENVDYEKNAEGKGLGLLKGRVSDNYVDADGSLWDCKMYAETSDIDEDQLRDYSLMERAGYVYDTQGNRIEVTSVNYLFSNRAAADANAWRLHGLADAWYVDKNGSVQLLK